MSPRSFLVALALALPAFLAISPAEAAPSACQVVKVGTDAKGNPIYERRCTGGEGDDGSDGSDGGGGSTPAEPTCTYEGIYNDFCIGDGACFMNDPAAVKDPPELKGREKPSEDSYPVYVSCKYPDGRITEEYSWSDEAGEGPTLAERAQSAIGRLTVPTFTTVFNPPTRTVVNLPTWWWAEGAPAGPVRGTEALGLVAVGTPTRMIVDPGDGSGDLVCPVVTARSDECSYVYRKASVRGTATVDGRKAYAASATIEYAITFEVDGTVIDIPGLPPELQTVRSTNDVAVPVVEVQTLSRPNR